MIETSAVMRMGRRRVCPACRMASRRGNPRSRNCVMNSMSRMALFTTMPASIMMPSSDMMLTVVRVTSSKKNTPIPASGRLNMIASGLSKDSNWAAMVM